MGKVIKLSDNALNAKVFWENKQELIKEPICPRCGFPEDVVVTCCTIIGHHSEILFDSGKHICNMHIIGDNIKVDPAKITEVENCIIQHNNNRVTMIVGQTLMGEPSQLYAVMKGFHEEENVRRLDRLATRTSPWLEKARAKRFHKAG